MGDRYKEMQLAREAAKERYITSCGGSSSKDDEMERMMKEMEEMKRQLSEMEEMKKRIASLEEEKARLLSKTPLAGVCEFYKISSEECDKVIHQLSRDLNITYAQTLDALYKDLTRVKSESTHHPYHISRPEYISEGLWNAAVSKTIGMHNIDSFEFTELHRAAFFFHKHNDPYLKNRLLELKRRNPLPIKPHINDKVITLFPHQVKTLEFMRERESLNSETIHNLTGGILCLEMGLGKTLIAITHSITSIRPPSGEEDRGFPTLVVCGKTLMSEWMTSGFEKFFGGEVKVLYFHDSFTPGIKDLTRKDILEYDFVITTYDVCSGICRKGKLHKAETRFGEEYDSMSREDKVAIENSTAKRYHADDSTRTGKELLYFTPWRRVVCDESQRFANPKTLTYRYMLRLYGDYKWCLTGTPIRNYVTDLWAQLRFLGYDHPHARTPADWKKNKAYDRLTIQHKLLEAVYRMGYTEAGITLPEKILREHVVVLQGNNDAIYKSVLQATVKLYNNMMLGGCSFACVLAMFTRLRQCIISPYILLPESKRYKEPKLKAEDEAIATSSMHPILNGPLKEWVRNKDGDAGINAPKIREALDIIEEESQKIIVFSSFTAALDLVAYGLEKRYPDERMYVQIDGSTTGVERADLLEQFKTSKTIRVLLIHYKIGSEGLNLTEAKVIIRLEEWWTDAVHRQGDARAWRVGQTNSVIVHRIFGKDTLEERIKEIYEGKNEMAENILKGASSSSGGTGLTKDTLGKILTGNHTRQEWW